MTPSDIAALEPIDTIKRRWPMVLGAVLTVGMMIGLAAILWRSGLPGLRRTTPNSPWFYVAFAALYMSPPTFDYIIFRRLWGIPLSGLVALMKKRVANDVLIGYSGDAYFYAWARARAPMVAAPFGAVKDVTILSAVAGNGITLLMMAIALPLGYALLPADKIGLVIGSAVVTLLITLPFLVFSRRVFSLPRRTLWWIFAMHCLRLMFGSAMVALAWHFAMPNISVGVWVFLAAGRLLVSRLPLVPNKEAVFFGFATLVIGQHQTLTDLLAFIAASTTLVHVVFIAIVAVIGLIRKQNVLL